MNQQHKYRCGVLPLVLLLVGVVSTASALQPVFRAQAYGNQSSDAPGTSFTFDPVVFPFDTTSPPLSIIASSTFDGSTGTFTCATAGYYHFTATVAVQFTLSGDYADMGVVTLIPLVNGNALSMPPFVAQNSGTKAVGVPSTGGDTFVVETPCPFMLYLIADDTVEIKATVTSGPNYADVDILGDSTFQGFRMV